METASLSDECTTTTSSRGASAFTPPPLAPARPASSFTRDGGASSFTRDCCDEEEEEEEEFDCRTPSASGAIAARAGCTTPEEVGAAAYQRQEHDFHIGQIDERGREIREGK